MAPSRAFSFPLSHDEEYFRQSPFTIDPSDAAHLTSCEAFRSIRDLLDCRDNNLFCDSHSKIGPRQKEAWLLQRDITFALMSPLMEVHRKATAVALSMLGKRNIFDLELVFRGEARGAFSWLQCLTTVEHSWCVAEGCPACNVSYVLQSEPIIRLVITACHLASRTLSPCDSPHDLPILDFWTDTLRRAIQEDNYWGRDSWKTLGDRAKGLEDGIFAMAQQCCELECIASDHDDAALLTQTNTDTITTSTHASASNSNQEIACPKINGYPTTKETWMHQIVLGCWTTLQADAKAHQSSRVTLPTSRSTEPKQAGRRRKEDNSVPRPLSAYL